MRRSKEQEMGRLYAKWQQSGKTKIAFCKDEGIIKSTFYYWVKKFQDPQPTVTKKRPAFTPLILEQNTLLNSKQPILRINYHTGVSIDFFDAVDADYIKGLCQ
jgi:transposase-like protein